jgi:glycosyltransferase involved in cell wall biosynthesis
MSGGASGKERRVERGYAAASVTRLLHILPHPGGGGERLVDMIERSGGAFEHRRTYLTRSRALPRAAGAIAAGRPRLAREVASADLVHVMGDAAACLTGRLLARRPSVIETQGLHLSRRSRGLAGALVRRLLRGAIAGTRLTVCSSEPELAELRAICGPREAARLRLVENGIAVPEPVPPGERVRARAELGIGDATFVVLYAGQLEPRKHPLVAAEAVAALERDAVLLVAGEGPLRERLARNTAVRLLGFRSDVPRLLAACDVFVMPSEREGLSLAVLEAMARGVAVVVSDGAGNPEAVGDAGVVVPLGDAGRLAGALDGLAADPERRRRLGAAARRRVSERYTIERWLADMHAVFAEALGGPGLRAPGPGAGGERA